MDRNTLAYSRAVDTDIYEYRGDDFLPIDVRVNSDALLVGLGGAQFRPAGSSSDSDQVSLQEIDSQQSSLPQYFYRTSTSQQSSLTSSQEASVSAVFLSQSQIIDWLWHRNKGSCINLFAKMSHSICPLTGEMYVC